MQTEVFKTVVRHRQVQTRVQVPMQLHWNWKAGRRPGARLVELKDRHANLPDGQFGRTGCVWKHPFIYIASGAGVGPGSGFAGVCVCKRPYLGVLYGVWPMQVEQTVDCWGLKTIGTQNF